MEDWKKSEGTFNLACDPQRARIRSVDLTVSLCAVSNVYTS